MLELLSKYSITEILIFIVILALAIKSTISFFDWVLDKFHKASNKEYKKKIKETEIEKHLREENELIKELQQKQKLTDNTLTNLSQKIDVLLRSDKDAIKTYITKEHHFFCYCQKWIDDFSLDCLERRYSRYQEQGGNSFIAGFMNELRQLPRQPINTNND